MYYNTILFFIFGLLVGSFLSVVVSRYYTKEGFTKGRSKCPKCKKEIRKRDLLPVISYILLKGKCRHCKDKISLFYPIIELSSAFIFAFMYLRFAPVLSGYNLYMFLGIYLAFMAVLLVIFAIDSTKMIIPDKFVLPAIYFALFLALLNIIIYPYGADFFIYQPKLINLLLGVLIGGGFFGTLVLLSSEKWMGWGDVKLGSFLGIVLGYPLILVCLFFSFVIGSLYSVSLIILGKKSRKDAIPFGPFLIIGSFIAIFFGKYILNWYLGM